MTTAWSPEQLRRFDDAGELEISSPRADGSWRPYLPIWVVCAGGEVYVRTWYRRTTGWFGHVVDAGRARVRVPGLEAEVTVQDVGAGSPDLRATVDGAYATEYGGGSTDRMVGDDAAATTLRLVADRSLQF